MTTFELYFCATVLRGACAVLFLLAVEAVLRDRLRAGFRRVLWLVCLVLMLVPQMNFSASPFRLDLSPLRQEYSSAGSTARAGKPGHEKGKGDIAPRAERRGIALRVLWQRMELHRKTLELATIALLPLPALLLLLARYLRCRRMIRPLPPVSDRRVLEAWNRVLAECGPLPRPVILLDSSRPDLGPTLFGCFTRKLLLPVGALHPLTDGELRLLLEHEYHHSKAGDPFVNIVALVLWALAWYNPFMLIARRKLRASCEMECDRKILARHPHAVREYGNLLLRFVSPSAPSASPVAIGLAESPRELSGRIRSMTAAVRLPGSRKSGRGMAILIAVTLAAPVGLVAVNAKPASRPRPAPAAKQAAAVKPAPVENPAPVIPEKPVLPHIVFASYGLNSKPDGLVACWKISYSENFPFEQSRLSLDANRKNQTISLAPEKCFLLLWKSGDTGYRWEASAVLPAEIGQKPFYGPAVLSPGKGTLLVPWTDPMLALQLVVDGIGPDELNNYRAVPSYR